MNDADVPNALAAGTQWVAALLTGAIGTSACVLSLAMLGFLMFLGHIPVRRGGAAIVGCFIVLSAGTIGEGLASRPMRSGNDFVELTPALSPPAPPAYNPYAFASLRQ